MRVVRPFSPSVTLVISSQNVCWVCWLICLSSARLIIVMRCFYGIFFILKFLYDFSCVAFLVWQGSLHCFDALFGSIANSAVLVLFVVDCVGFWGRLQCLFVSFTLVQKSARMLFIRCCRF